MGKLAAGVVVGLAAIPSAAWAQQNGGLSEVSIWSEFAKYGPALLLAVLVILGLSRAVVTLFNKYTEAQERNIQRGEKVVEALEKSTVSTNNNTAAILALKDAIWQSNSSSKGP